MKPDIQTEAFSKQLFESILVTRSLFPLLMLSSFIIIFFNSLCLPRYTVGPLSDRMGVRLQCEGPGPSGGQTLSEGVAPGSIQLPPDGQPILLLADHQATGGYLVPGNARAANISMHMPPMIVNTNSLFKKGVVAEVDIWCGGQMRPGLFL